VKARRFYVQLDIKADRTLSHSSLNTFCKEIPGMLLEMLSVEVYC